MNQAESEIQQQLYGIAIYEQEIVMVDYTGTDEKRFVVQPEQLMGFFRTEVTFKPFPGLIWMKTDTTTETYLLTLPAGLRTIFYEHNKKVVTRKLTMPSIVVMATIDSKRRKISEIDMWGYGGKGITPETVLYELPLPNLTGSRLCLGSTERAAGADVREAVEKTIFDTPFNHHHLIVGRDNIPFLDYVKKYKGKCPFPTLNVIGTCRQIFGGTI